MQLRRGRAPIHALASDVALTLEKKFSILYRLRIGSPTGVPGHGFAYAGRIVSTVCIAARNGAIALARYLTTMNIRSDKASP